MSQRTISLPQLPASDGEAPARPRRHYGRWRAASLIAVHVLIALHIAHWCYAGTTLAPLELNEVMHTLELGIVTAGFVLMSLIVVSVAVFGRFFCSWGCHILALQDLCGWIFRKARIRAKPVRSRVLRFVAPAAMLYMFVWPHVRKLIEGQPLPALHLRDDAGGWASFVTDDFWRNLPGLGVTGLTFLVCGFLIVYVLGTRSFCQYVCPYGAIFGIMDRVAPGRIRVDPDKCTSCGVCTGVCDSHIRVHEEVALHGRVVDSACLKDLDCVSACPENALSYGWTRPSLLTSFRPARRRIPYDFTLAEDMLMAAVFIGTLVTFRGLYGLGPFLLSLAAAGILSYLAVLCTRLVWSEHVRFNRFQLKRKRNVTPAGRGFALIAVMIWVFVIHSALIRSHEVRGRRALSQATLAYQRGADPAVLRHAAGDARMHLAFCARWGLLTAPDHAVCMASACWTLGDVSGAERSWRRAIERNPDDHRSRLDLASSLAQRGRGDRAVPLLQTVAQARERSRTDAARYAHYRASATRMLAALSETPGSAPAAAGE
ncbi:MAG: 4Fe-4S binding protein [Phycisphaerales bacterium]|nr:4Fe-4S binding protein [Phycisphaerae bacterium]NNF43894.1 4Fe-4S binding protein [Phycisphaerales bacterium]NNM25604.1 4Fe-4S binding protein [Phycisphaerales bacterium]